jgi:hypothetical protein
MLAMTARPVPVRHWRSDGNDPLPTGAEAMNQPFRAFPSWFMRVTCERCGKDRMISETHTIQGNMLIREVLKRMRHDGCGGRPGRVELLTGIEGASSRPVRKIVLRED